jgi:hypothetical protein
VLKKYLEGAVTDLQQLMKLTEEDIEDIKKGNHIEIFDRASVKEKLVETFESKKKAIDNEITKKAKLNKGIPLETLLDDIEKKYLEALKSGLLSLKELNRRYARLVVSVGTFYSSLLEKVVPTEMDGYETVVKNSASFLEIKG